MNTFAYIMAAAFITIWAWLIYKLYRIVSDAKHRESDDSRGK